MKAKLSLFLFTMLLCASVAFAVNGTGYYNLFSIRTGSGMYESITLVLSQDGTPCTDNTWSLKYDNTTYVSDGNGGVGYNSYGGWGYFPTVTFNKTGECVAAVKDTPLNLKTMLDAQWVKSTTYKGRSLYLGSDIDLGEYSSTTKAGACDVNHEPLPMPANTGFNGKNFKISHLCYVSDTPMKKSMGLFEVIESSQVQDIVLSGIRIAVGGSSNGLDYYPVGALAGWVNMSTVKNIVLADDSIQAPMAGGLAGYAKNSTFDHITGDDDIYISNKVSVTDSFPGAKVVFSDDNRGASLGNKAFLGGLVGMVVRNKANATFVNDTIKVDVHDFGSNKATVGGLAGLFGGVNDSVVNVSVYNKVKPTETIYSSISGGMSMGGFFGMAAPYVENNSATLGDLLIKNSSFSGKIYGGKTEDFIAVGGFIGRDSLWQAMSVKILNSRSSAEISDSLTKAGNYRYYAGGFVGGSSYCPSSSDPTDFLSFVGSNASGSINFAASAKAVPGIHARSFVGGFAGSACLASGQNGLYNDTSSVRIYVNNRTAFNGGSSVGDSVNVGGFVGRANSGVADSLKIENLLFTGKVTVADSLNEVRVGGIIGNFPEADGGKTVNFKNVLVNTDTVFALKSAAASKGSATSMLTAKLGSLCGYCKSFSQVEMIGVVGSMYANSSYSGDSLVVGGLLGGTYIASDKPSGSVFDIHNTFTIGDIMVSANSAVVKKGYLFGTANVNRAFDVKSNYHYGEGDGDVDAIGYMLAEGLVVDDWKTSKYIHYVIRNGASSKYTSVHHDGTMKVDSMKTSFFAGFLNAAYDKEADYAWTYVAGKNSNLPFFADLRNKAISPSDEITYTVTFVNKNGETIKQVSGLLPGNDVAAPTEEEVNACGVEGYTWLGTWDKDFDNVTSDLTVTAQYSPIPYTVSFKTPAGDLISEPEMVEYGKAATVPSDEEIMRTGYIFLGWRDSSYLEVTKNLEIIGDYEAIKYRITFMNGDSVIKVDSVSYGENVPTPTELTKAPSDGFTYSFKGWNPEVVTVAGDAVYKAVFDSLKKQFTVVFVDSLGERIGDTCVVDFGDPAVVPAIPEKEGRKFVKWLDSSFVNVTKDLRIVAQYDTIMYRVVFKNHEGVVIHDSYYKYHADMSVAYPLARPATENYSYEFKGWSPELGILTSDIEVTATYDSTYIGPTSSSSEPESSSSITSSSSSSEPSSSSVEIKLVSPKFEVSGNAVRLTFDTENANVNTKAQVTLIGSDGSVIDTVLDASVVEGGVWKMEPVPMGQFSAQVSLIDLKTDEVLDSFKDSASISVPSRIEVMPRSWQMVSIAAMDKSVLKGSDVVFYWWDEENPVGDYWQYRAYAGEEVESTRGFWYGSFDGSPIVLKDASVEVSEEIVWKLDSLYSGWNLVANPYGWYVNLENGKTDNGEDVKFWSWNPETASYSLATVLAPYEAIWAKVKNSTTFRVSSAPDYDAPRSLGVPPSPAQKKAALHKFAARKASPSNWTLAVRLDDENGRSDSWNVLGAGAVAETMSEPPVGMGERVSLAIRETAKGEKLAKSIKAVADSYEWTLDVTSNRARDGKISFDGIRELKSLGLSLYVTSDGLTRELNEGDAVSVALGTNSRTIDVRVAASNSLTVASGNLNGFRTIQKAGSLQVGFNAPEALAGARGRYALVGVDGRKVASGNFTALAGANSLNMVVPKSGIYFMQVKVGSQTMNAKVMVK